MSALHDALASALAPYAVCNLDTPDEGDRTTWRCGFTDAATADQRVAAAGVLATFVLPVAVPDGPTLSDWRVALTLWGRMDDVTAKVAALVASSDPKTALLGKIARERLEYANNVFRKDLVALKDAVGFTAADIDESLFRAHQVDLGDLSGKWPLA